MTDQYNIGDTITIHYGSVTFTDAKIIDGTGNRDPHIDAGPVLGLHPLQEMLENGWQVTDHQPHQPTQLEELGETITVALAAPLSNVSLNEIREHLAGPLAQHLISLGWSKAPSDGDGSPIGPSEGEAQ